MTNYECRLSLLETLCKRVGLRFTKLVNALDALEGTIRNDLDVVEEKGEVKRVLAEIVLKERRQPIFSCLTCNCA